MTIHDIFHYQKAKVQFCLPHKINRLCDQFGFTASRRSPFGHAIYVQFHFPSKLWQHILMLQGTSAFFRGSLGRIVN